MTKNPNAAYYRWLVDMQRNVLIRQEREYRDLLAGYALPENVRLRLWLRLLEVQDCLSMIDYRGDADAGRAAA
jgi:hypothetical protein